MPIPKLSKNIVVKDTERIVNHILIVFFIFFAVMKKLFDPLNRQPSRHNRTFAADKNPEKNDHVERKLRKG